MNSPLKKPTEKLFDEIQQFIAESKDLLAQDAMMELAGLDEKVRILCAAVLQLSQEERLYYADRLQKLLGELKALGDTMIEKREQIAEEIRGVPQHQKASVAYRVVDASVKKEED